MPACRRRPSRARWSAPHRSCVRRRRPSPTSGPTCARPRASSRSSRSSAASRSAAWPNSFGRMAANLDGLDERLDLIATDLESNRTALVANATSLSALGARLGLVADDLRGGVVEEGFADLRSSATVLAVGAARLDDDPRGRCAMARLVAPARGRPRGRRLVAHRRSRRKRRPRGEIAAHAVDPAAGRRR